MGRLLWYGQVAVVRAGHPTSSGGPDGQVTHDASKDAVQNAKRRAVKCHIKGAAGDALLHCAQQNACPCMGGRQPASQHWGVMHGLKRGPNPLHPHPSPLIP